MALITIALAGCPSNKPVPPVTVTPKPYANVTLKIAGSDAVLMKALFGRAQGWAARNDAKVEMVISGADVMIISAAEVGALASRNEIVTLPDELKAADHPGQHDSVLPVYRDKLATWAGVAKAVPLAGDAALLVMRTDKLADTAVTAKHLEKFGKALPNPPTTWEDIAEIAETIAELNATAMAPLSPDEYLRAAACYDRVALSETDLIRNARETQGNASTLSFFHDANTGEPRLNSPGFIEAVKLMKRIQPARLKSAADPVAALASGNIAIAILNLHQVGRLPRENGVVQKHFGIAPLPGTRSAYDAKRGAFADFTSRPGGNFIPYFAGGSYGVVTSACSHPAAAWDLLADLGSPGRSLETLSDVALGCGPFRSEHLMQKSDAVWQRYGFDASRSTTMTEALKRGADRSIANVAITLRGPDSDALFKLLTASVLQGVDGKLTPEAAMQQANDAWKQHDAATPNAKAWRRRAAGLE